MIKAFLVHKYYLKHIGNLLFNAKLSHKVIAIAMEWINKYVET